MRGHLVGAYCFDILGVTHYFLVWTDSSCMFERATRGDARLLSDYAPAFVICSSIPPFGFMDQSFLSFLHVF